MDRYIVFLLMLLFFALMIIFIVAGIIYDSFIFHICILISFAASLVSYLVYEDMGLTKEHEELLIHLNQKHRKWRGKQEIVKEKNRVLFKIDNEVTM